MDSLIDSAARALQAGDPLAALKRIALRDDAPALALRGIAMAQLGDLARAKELLSNAARGFGAITRWWEATASAIEACECPAGCPSCVQSPKCGNGNDPLDKDGAVRALRLVLDALTRG